MISIPSNLGFGDRLPSFGLSGTSFSQSATTSATPPQQQQPQQQQPQQQQQTQQQQVQGDFKPLHLTQQFAPVAGPSGVHTDNQVCLTIITKSLVVYGAGGLDKLLGTDHRILLGCGGWPYFAIYRRGDIQILPIFGGLSEDWQNLESAPPPSAVFWEVRTTAGNIFF